ncbi:MAG: hypothetical protein SGJ18_14240 [Pseudomonadota bacterium]|nr:hypothetical protein [Pseudomonadota bacterium]
MPNHRKNAIENTLKNANETANESAEEKAKEFLKTKHLYLLGDLVTEQPHPLTTNLSQMANDNLAGILPIIRKIELKLVDNVFTMLPDILKLQSDIERTLNEGHRIFICGCGATGRLALTLEFLWRKLATKDQKDRVIGFMAGGDVALVRSLERIEDLPEMGAQHLMSLGFQKKDLLISVTEGGETPYVIGATEKAAQYSERLPYFLFCNPKELLIKKVERSKGVITNKQIRSISLPIDPMVLAGSTRLQATTALLLAVGSALFPMVTTGSPQSIFHEYGEAIKNLELLDLINFIETESKIYMAGDKLQYTTTEFGITILTDTTERSPTFSLAPFENRQEPLAEMSLCYLKILHTSSAKEAWEKLLLRSPKLNGRPDWIVEKGVDWIFGYDLSSAQSDLIDNHRKNYRNKTFNIEFKDGGFCFDLDGQKKTFLVNTQNLFIQHLVLKILLNTHSTLLMGRLKRYQNNIMTYVKPSCGKLIDRAIRCVQYILFQENLKHVDYDKLAHLVFEAMDGLGPTESIVMKVLGKIKLNK